MPTPKVALVVISDRGDLYLPRAMAAAEQFIAYPIPYVVMVEDPDHKMTASGAVRAGWEVAVENDVDFVFHLEEDFLLTEPVDIPAMAACLDANQHLAQLVLKRQPWNGSEIEAGGIIETGQPGEYIDCDGWVEHRRLFSLNPCLVPRRILDLGFPEGSERGFTELLLEKSYCFGFWGKREDPPRCFHIGTHKAPGGRM